MNLLGIGRILPGGEGLVVGLGCGGCVYGVEGLVPNGVWGLRDGGGELCCGGLVCRMLIVGAV